MGNVSARLAAAEGGQRDVDSAPSDALTPLFAPGRNVWRVAHAKRATVLIDAAAYFEAVRAAMLEAEHCIYIVGWDVDSRTQLVGPSGVVTDGFPPALGDFLDALAARRPHLKIRILLWDYSVFFADEREPLPSLALRWKRLPQIDLCLDGTVPLGAGHHQKIVVIDDGVAFAGGLDLTIRRWDDCDHRTDNALRVDPAGKYYPPFHDVQIAVDGPAAEALAELVRVRWERAACEAPTLLPQVGEAWPAFLKPDFEDVTLAIARTEPAFEKQPEIREIESLFVDMIRRAERTIYIESQYLTLVPIAQTLAAQLRARPRLEVVIMCPFSYHGVMERQAMLPGRTDFIRLLEDSEAPNRWLVAAPCIADVDISLHSKVMIIDDTYLRIGSANLCNRSMATDSECDLVIEADTREAAASIRQIRNRLLAEHCGCSAATFEATLRRQHSLIHAVHTTSARTQAIKFVSADAEAASMPILKSIADPEQPIALQRYVSPFASWFTSRPAAWAFLAVVLIGFCALSAAWGFSPLSETSEISAWERSLSAVSGPWAGFAVVGVFVLAGLIAFPVVLLIIGTVAVFGLWPGLGFAAAGAMASAMTTYAIGWWIGNRALRRLCGPRLNRITDAFLERGIMAVTIIRLVPAAPYTLVNLAAGALRIHPIDYAIGTALGLAPGFAVMALMGRQIMEIIADPTPLGIVALIGILMLSIAVSYTLQRAIGALRKRNS
jgi:phospholipase D1/2